MKFYVISVWFSSCWQLGGGLTLFKQWEGGQESCWLYLRLVICGSSCCLPLPRWMCRLVRSAFHWERKIGLEREDVPRLCWEWCTVVVAGCPELLPNSFAQCSNKEMQKNKAIFHESGEALISVTNVVKPLFALSQFELNMRASLHSA